MRVILAAVLALAATARADSRQADEEFARGRTLLASGKFDEACAAFADSLRHDFQYGTLYNVGTCEEKRGHHASALRAFRRLAAEDPNATRRAESARFVQAITPRVSKLMVALPERAAGLVITLDTIDVTGQATAVIELDPGPHAILATAPGRRAWQTTATIVEDATVVRLTIALDIDTSPVAIPRSTVTTSVEPLKLPEYGRPRTARALVYGGLVGMAAGGVFFVFAGIAASRNYHCAIDKPPDASCLSLHVNDVAYANQQIHNLRVDGAITDAIELLSIVAISYGAYLWRHSDYEVVVLPAGAAGTIALTGSF